MSSARYGVDAPGVMLGLLGGGLGGFAAGGCLVAAGFVLVGSAVTVIAFVPAALGVAMVAYALAGKIRVRERMLGQVAWRGDEQVLDVGTGAGLLLVGAARRLSTGRAVGVDVWSARDLSGNGIERTWRNVATEGVGDRARVETADARQLPFPDASFDVVLSLLCLHNIEGAEGRRAACFEIARVLRPGGVVVVGDYLPTGGYSTAFRDARLVVETSGPAFRTALSLMWLLGARKPHLTHAP